MTADRPCPYCTPMQRAVDAYRGELGFTSPDPRDVQITARVVSALLADEEAMVEVLANRFPCLVRSSRRYCGDSITVDDEYMHPSCAVAAIKAHLLGEQT